MQCVHFTPLILMYWKSIYNLNVVSTLARILSKVAKIKENITFQITSIL